jgi:heme-degrading monooxygenase HmoA
MWGGLAMYGSVSRWRVKEGKQDELERLLKEISGERAPGSRALNVYHSDADTREYWVAGVFESREAYTSNSATPEQSGRFQRLRELMDSDPEWHDGEVVLSY